MAEYIEREALVTEILRLTIMDSAVAAYADTVLYCIQRMSAENMSPMVHGQWLKVETDYLTRDLLKRCSVCGYVGVKPHGNYCPSCGAKMQEAR